MKYQANNQAIDQVSHLQQLWKDGGFALTVQLPPLGVINQGVINQGVINHAPTVVAQLAAQTTLFDAVLVADAPDGAVALSSLAMAVLLKRAGIETIVQFSGRDRNRLALQSDILSLGALGMPNLLIDMRPVVRAALLHNTDARLVTDLDGPALLATAIRLRDEARFISGTAIKTPPALYIGAFVALEEHIQVSPLSSAQFVVTMPVFDTHRFAATLATFQAAHADFLQFRPLLVSLPLLTDSTVEGAVTPGVTPSVMPGIQKIASSIELLKGLAGVRGFNLVVSKQTDLALLEQIVRKANSSSVGRE